MNNIEEDQKPKSLFCFGYGYTCDYLGHALQQMGGWHIAGTTRDIEKRDALRLKGIKAHIFDYEQPLLSPADFFHGVTHILISTPPSDDGDPSYLMHANDILAIPTLEWVGYLSTTGVYGDRDGGIVTEESELRPSSKRGSRRKMAEQQWFSLCHSNASLPVHSFRLAGIYGPGRSALDSVRAGIARRIDKPGHAFNRIHVEDIVQVLLASMTNPSSCSTYNLADDEPAPSHAVIEYACALLQQPVPPIVPFDSMDMSPMARSFYSDNKRVQNNKIKEQLGVALKYPNYRAGLEACLEAERQAGLLIDEAQRFPPQAS